MNDRAHAVDIGLMVAPLGALPADLRGIVQRQG
jgi:hypothetical protein